MPDLLSALSQDPASFPTEPLNSSSQCVLLEGFLRRDQLAQELGISPRTIDRWEALRIGPPRVCVGRTILYNIQSVREWLLSSEGRPLPIRKQNLRSKGKRKTA